MKYFFITSVFGVSTVLAQDVSSIINSAVQSASTSDSSLRGAGNKNCYLGADQCRRGKKFCMVNDGDCMIADAAISGQCKSTNVGCNINPYGDESVCGCDGKTYKNRCLARKNGVNIQSDGECLENCVIGQVPCKIGYYCKVWDGMCAMTGTYGYCEKIPDLSFCVDREDQPVCGCDGQTYQCRMDADRAGVNVMRDGDCAQVIVNSGSPAKRALDIKSGANSGCADGVSIIAYSQNDQDWQRWKFNSDGTIESVHCPGMVLDVEYGVNSNCAAGSRIVLWHNSGSPWQKWTHDNGMLFSQYCPNMVIEIEGADNDGADIQLGNEIDGWNQIWEFH